MKATATNTQTGEQREVNVDEQEMEDVLISEHNARCSGPCECEIEPDGECPQGWPSRMVVVGVI